MKIIYARLLGLMLFEMFFLCACGYKHKVEWQGHYLYIDGEKYTDTGGLYNESNIKIGKSNGFTIYEVVGDTEHNYVRFQTNAYMLKNRMRLTKRPQTQYVLVDIQTIVYMMENY